MKIWAQLSCQGQARIIVVASLPTINPSYDITLKIPILYQKLTVTG